MDGWKTFAFPFGKPNFQLQTVSFMEGMWVDPGGEQGSFVSLLNGCTLTGDKNGCTAAHWAAYKDFQWTSDEFGVLYHK